MKQNLSLVSLTACVMALTLILNAPAFGAPQDDQIAKLQGTWIMVSGEYDGKPLKDEHVKGSKIQYEGKQGKLIVPHQHGEEIVFEIIEIDPAKNPKEFKFVRKNGPLAGKEVTAIYEFIGDDQYQFALDPKGTEKPKDFSAKEGSGYMKHIWKKAK